MITGEDLIEVEFVIAEENHTLAVQFSNGQKRKINLSHLLKNPPPVFFSLRDQNEFKKVSVNPVGGVQWECGADLSADFLLSA